LVLPVANIRRTGFALHSRRAWTNLTSPDQKFILIQFCDRRQIGSDWIWAGLDCPCNGKEAC